MKAADFSERCSPRAQPQVSWELPPAKIVINPYIDHRRLSFGRLFERGCQRPKNYLHFRLKLLDCDALQKLIVGIDYGDHAIQNKLYNIIYVSMHRGRRKVEDGRRQNPLIKKIKFSQRVYVS